MGMSQLEIHKVRLRLYLRTFSFVLSFHLYDLFRPMIIFTSIGIYCKVGDFYIDPWRPVRKALITHGHSDHATKGHQYYIATNLSKPLLKHRLGYDIHITGLEYGEKIIINGVKVSFHPAGHVIGSAQIRLEHKGEIWVISGDYKTENDGLSTPFEPIPCHHFVTECTFGLPTFRWKNQNEVFQQINTWWAKNASEGKPTVISSYSLGKAQRLITSIDLSIGPLLTHRAIENTHDVLREAGHKLPIGGLFSSESKQEDYRRAIILCPPSALGSVWAKKIKNSEEAALSGWMSIKGIKRRRNVQKGFVLSDHADWNGLLESIKSTGAENIYTTHGYKDILAQYLREELHLNAQPVYTEYQGEEIDTV